MTLCRTRTIILALVLAGWPWAAISADFQVSTLADGEDAIPGDGICATTDGSCTLRAAVTEADSSPGSTVRLLAGVHALDLGPLTPTSELRLLGLGRNQSALDATGHPHAVDGFGALTLESLEIRGGSDVAVRSSFEVALEGCRITQAGQGVQGFIVNISDSEIIGCDDAAVSGSHVAISGSRLEGNGSGVGDSDRSCVVTDTDIVGNRGVGVSSFENPRLTRCRVQDNLGTGVEADQGEARLEDCIVTNNSGRFVAGGINVAGGSVTLLRCQVRDNGRSYDVFGFQGGSIIDSHVGALSDGFGFDITPTTVVRNSTIGTIWGGRVSATHATVGSLEAESAFLGNTVTLTCPVVTVTRSGDGNWTPLACDVDGVGNLQGDDPMLSPLEGNASGIFSRAPLPGSPLVEAGNPSVVEAFDQNGRPRPLDFDGDGVALPDIGAIELCPDGDADGTCDHEDCAPGDPSAARTPFPAEQRVGFDGLATTVVLTWPTDPAAERYTVARGDLGELWRTARLETECIGETVEGTFSDPASWARSLYLVRGSNACGGSWGRGDSGDERLDCL